MKKPIEEEEKQEQEDQMLDLSKVMVYYTLILYIKDVLYTQNFIMSIPKKVLTRLDLVYYLITIYYVKDYL